MNKHGYKKSTNGNGFVYQKKVVSKSGEVAIIRVGGANFGEADLVTEALVLIAKNEDIEPYISENDYEEMIEIVSAWNDECDKELVIPIPDAVTIRAMFCSKDMFWNVMHKYYKDIVAAVIMAILMFIVAVIMLSF